MYSNIGLIIHETVPFKVEGMVGSRGNHRDGYRRINRKGKENDRIISGEGIEKYKDWWEGRRKIRIGWKGRKRRKIGEKERDS